MDKNAIKKYAVWARRELISRVSQRALQYGVSEKEIIDADVESVHGNLLSDAEKRQRKALVARVKRMGYEQTMEEAAYTWFNRFIALRFMEVNGYLPTHIRVFTDEENSFKPQILVEAIHLDPETMPGLDMEKVYAYKDKNQTDELFKYLIVTQCNALISILPGMFTRIDDYTEMLFPDNLLRDGSAVEQMVTTIPEDDWKDAVQIIGWLYQYYNTEPKDKVFADLKKNIKISKENIPAATQLFTPDWIVRYMVENSLGRLWLERERASQLSNTTIGELQGMTLNDLEKCRLGPVSEDDMAKAFGWKYYLPEAEQEPEVEVQLKEIRKKYRDMKPEDIRCMDPCMGSGHILVYMFDVLMQIYESYGNSARDAVKSIVENNLYGLDIDDRAAQLAYFAVMMKARQYDRRFFTRSIQPHVSAIMESQPISDMSFLDLCGEEKSIALKVYECFKDAKEYGSILQPEITLEELDALEKRLDEIFEMSSYGDLFAQQRCDTITNTVYPLVEQARTLVQKYDVVVTNPPYMGSTGVSDKLMVFTKKVYPDSRSDMCTIFMERAIEMCTEHGFSSMINTPAWMTMSSFEKLREKLIDEHTFVNMVHFGRGIFGADFGTTAFVINKGYFRGYVAVYRKLFFRFGLVDSIEEKEARFNGGMGYYTADSSMFKLIPGLPLAYWISKKTLKVFSSSNTIGSFGKALQGTITGNNEHFLRYWFEINKKRMALNGERGYKWYPHNKGGNYRKWYGNREYVINWENNGRDIRTFVDSKGKLRSRPQNIDSFFIQGISWSDLTAGKYSTRFYPNGSTFDATGPTIPFKDATYLNYLLGNMNSVVFQMLLDISCPGIHYNNGVITKLPVIIDDNRKAAIDKTVAECIDISRSDWDSFETSWDFKQHPLVEYRHSVSKVNAPDSWYLKDAYEAWEYQCNLCFDTLKANEEELNRIFIDIYGLQDELTPEVEDKDVTVRLADKKRDIRSLISYAVGCMFGRYSLYKEGLFYAGGPWDFGSKVDLLSDYAKASGVHPWNPSALYLPDRDNVIPICDDEYFDDDIVARFVRFIEVVYGKETLDENLHFIADALGGSGQPKDVIRNYFLNDFYADHLKIYQKRPIYWLFDSGKKGGFKALIYMHRYQPDTIARIRTDYVFEQQARYRTAIADLEQRMANAATSERVKLTKQLQKLQAQDAEIRTYEEKIHHLADQMIPIDLDNGVKHNYEIFKDVLAPIK